MTQEEFYSNISDWISKPKSEWNHITLMAYFCHKYESKNGVRFRLVRWKGSPGMGKESRDFSKLIKILLPENFSELDRLEASSLKKSVILKVYNYINWMFDYKFRSGQKSVTGTGIFLMPSMINEFERMYSSFIKKNDDSGKFSSLMDWCRKECPSIFEMHQIDDLSDLVMLSKYVDNAQSPSREEALVVNRAKEVGLI